MNRTRKSPQRPLTHSIAAVVAVFLTSHAGAAIDTWVGNTSANWNDLNWTGGNNPPVSGDSLIFDIAGTAGATLNNNLTPLFNVLGITFNAAASPYTFTGNAITLSGNVLNTSISPQALNFDMTLGAVRNFATTAGGGDITLGGVLSGTGGYMATGGGILNVANTANTFTNEIQIGGGVVNTVGAVVNVASLSDYGVPSSIGARLQSQETATGNGIGLHFRSGTLQYTGSTPQSTNREIRLQNGTTGGTIDASGSTPTATLSFTHTGPNINLFDTGGTRTLTLTGTNTGNNSFSIQLTNQAANQTSLQKTGPGTWLIPNSDNTYTGETIMVGGILNVASLSDYGVPSSIGSRALSDENTTVTGVSLHFQGGTLQYTGSTPQSTNRNIRFIIGNGATLDASGSNPDATMSFTHTGANINLFDTPGDRTLTLTGTNTGNNGFSIVLANQAGSPTNLSKTGPGTWILNGPDTNTATGTTSVTGGTLILSKTNATPVSGPLMIGDGSSAAVVLLGGTGGNQIEDSTVVGFIDNGLGGSILRMNNINETVGGLSSFGGGIVENEAGVAGTATITINVPTGAFQSFDGTLRNGNGTGVDGTLAVVKVGPGNLTLAGASTHTGATSVAAGTLTVTGSLNGSAVSVANATLDGSGSITGPVTIENNGVVDSTGTFTGTVTINNGGRLSGTSTVSGTVNATSGGRISPAGPTAPGTLSIGSLNLSAGSLLDFEFGPLSDLINITSSNGLTVNGGAFNLYEAGGVNPLITNNTYVLLDYTGTLGGALSNLSIANSQVGKFYSLANDTANTRITLTVADTTISEWNGSAGNGLWSAAGNWIGVVPNSPGAVAKLGPIPTAPTAISVNGPKTVGGILFDNANSYTVNGGAAEAITLDNGVAAASLTVTTGNHTIAAPITLASGANASTATGTSLTITGNITGGKPFQASGSGTTILLGANAFGTTAVTGGILQVGNNGTTGTLGTGDVSLANGTSLVFNRSDDLAVPNSIFGTGGVVTKLGNGILTLSGSNSFGTTGGGGLNLNGGTVKLGSANALASGVLLNFNGGTLDLNANGATAGLLNGGTGSITDNGPGAGTTALVINQGTDATFEGNITDGAGRSISLTKAGIGILTLAGANTFTGRLTITGGTVIAAGTGNNVPIVSNVTVGDGSDTVWLIAGGLTQQFGAGTVMNFSNGAKNAKFQLRGSNQTLAGLESTADPTTALTIIQNDEVNSPGYLGDPGLATLTLNTTTDHVFAGLIRNQAGGGLNLVKEGPATQEIQNILVQTDNFTSATVNAGKLVFNFFPNGLQTNNLPVTTSVIVNTAGTLALRGTTIINGSISGDGNIIVDGQDTVTLVGVNTFTKGITLQSGTLGIGGNQAMGDALAPVVINGGILRASGAERQVPNPIIANASFTLGRLTHLNGGVTLNADTTITANNFDGPANGLSNLGAVTGNFRLSLAQGPQGIGTGALVINGLNTNGGGTSVLSGRVTVSAAGALSNANLTVDGGELNLGNSAQTVSSLSGAGGTINLLPGHTLTVEQATDTTFAGVLGNSGGLTKSGAGSLTLTGTSNGLIGPVNVTAGALLVNGSMTGSTAAVTGGRLGGTGRVGSVTLDGGTLAPGVTTGILNTGSVTLNRGTVEFQLNGLVVGQDYDQVNVTGSLILLQDTQMVLSLGASFAEGDLFTLFNNDSTDPVSLGGLLTVNGNTLTEGEKFGVGAQQFQISYAAGLDANDIVLIAVPEPSSVAALLSAGMVVGLVRRRKTAARFRSSES